MLLNNFEGSTLAHNFARSVHLSDRTAERLSHKVAFESMDCTLEVVIEVLKIASRSVSRCGLITLHEKPKYKDFC